MPGFSLKPKIDHARLLELRGVFDGIDKDHGGSLNQEEVAQFLSDQGEEPGLAPIIFKMWDTDGDGNVTFDEFAMYWLEAEKLTDDALHIYRLAFNALDENGDKKIDLDEFIKFSGTFGLTDGEQHARERFVTADLDGDGTISFPELVVALALE
jgi:Ca2+-binding EF-hand superfamily protein